MTRPLVRLRRRLWWVTRGRTPWHHGDYYYTHHAAMHAARQIAITEANR